MLWKQQKGNKEDSSGKGWNMKKEGVLGSVRLIQAV